MTKRAEDSVELILRLLRQSLGEDTFTYYDGDPDQIPLFNLPAIIVEQTQDSTVGGTYAEDDITDTVTAKVVLNKKDDWNGADADESDGVVRSTTHTKVRQIITGRDEETGRYLPNTVKGALRPEVYGDRRIGNELTVDIGVAARPTSEGQRLITAEGHVTVTILYSVDVDPLEAQS